MEIGEDINRGRRRDDRSGGPRRGEIHPGRPGQSSERRIEDALLARLVRDCTTERLDALVDVALASGSTVKAVVGGALHSHTKRGAVPQSAGKTSVKKTRLNVQEGRGLLENALEQCGGDDVPVRQMCF